MFFTPFPSDRFWYGLLAALCLLVLLLTVAPTILITDSPELVAAAHTLGIPHAPGYPLYTLTAHVFSWLPFENPAYRINLYSVFCLVLTVPLAHLIQQLTHSKLAGAAASLTFAWSYYIWTIGIVAEIYAPQVLMLTVCGWLLVRYYRQPSATGPFWLGACFGLAVGMVPSSILFAPGLVMAFLLLKIPIRICLLSGLTSLLVFGACLLYFPVAAQADPALNSAGRYNSEGEFVAVDVQTASGIWWLTSGRQFEHYFFAEGILPTGPRLAETAFDMFGNFLGMGLLLAVLGAYQLYRQTKLGLLVWAAFFLPYTYFYLCYGADDRDTMFAPAYLLLAILIGYGLQYALEDLAPFAQRVGYFALPAVLLAVNFPLVDASHYHGLDEQSAVIFAALPPEAYVFGNWPDAMPLIYAQIVERQRPDVSLYNLFFFKDGDAKTYIDHLLREDKTVIFLGDVYLDTVGLHGYRYTTLLSIEHGPHNELPIRIIQAQPSSEP